MKKRKKKCLGVGLLFFVCPILVCEDFPRKYGCLCDFCPHPQAYFFLAAAEEKYGIEIDRRDRVLRTLIRNLYSFHQQEIFLTVVNEYTDWTRPFQHPLNVLDGTSLNFSPSQEEYSFSVIRVV